MTGADRYYERLRRALGYHPPVDIFRSMLEHVTTPQYVGGPPLIDPRFFDSWVERQTRKQLRDQFTKVAATYTAETEAGRYVKTHRKPPQCRVSVPWKSAQA